MQLITIQYVTQKNVWRYFFITLDETNYNHFKVLNPNDYYIEYYLDKNCQQMFERNPRINDQISFLLQYFVI